MNTDKNKKKILEIVEEPIIIDAYTIEHEPYVSSEFVSPNIIPVIMKHFFPSYELLLSYNENHQIYKIKIKDLLTDKLTNWEYNRPADIYRCQDIAQYIYNSKKPIDTMFYLSFNNIKEIFEILDGNHRITSFKIIFDNNYKLHNCCISSKYDDNNQWLLEQYLLINIRFNSTIGELIDVFKNLNKSQTVPDLYIRDHTKDKRDIIDTIINEWMGKYKKHFSSSANPKIGNINRNNFVQLLDIIYDKYSIDETKINKFRDILDNANNTIASNIPSKASIDIRAKCQESGCYLFLYKNSKLEEII